MLLRDFRAEPLQTFDMQINRSRADGASAGDGDAGALAASNQWSENKRRSPHCLHNFIRYFRRKGPTTANRGSMVRAPKAELDLGSHSSHELAFGFDVPYLGNVFQDYRLFTEQGRGHGGHSGILGSTDANGSEQRVSAADNEFIHMQIIPVLANP